MLFCQHVFVFTCSCTAVCEDWLINLSPGAEQVWCFCCCYQDIKEHNKYIASSHHEFVRLLQSKGTLNNHQSASSSACMPDLLLCPPFVDGPSQFFFLRNLFVNLAKDYICILGSSSNLYTKSCGQQSINCHQSLSCDSIASRAVDRWNDFQQQASLFSQIGILGLVEHISMFSTKRKHWISDSKDKKAAGFPLNNLLSHTFLQFTLLCIVFQSSQQRIWFKYL